MRGVIVRYKVKPERAAENAALVRAVYEELDGSRPAGFHYATFQLEDGVTFVHVASMESAPGDNPLASVEAFTRFTAGIGERCDEPPVVTEGEIVGSYSAFG
jgi:hypothetical protein